MHKHRYLQSLRREMRPNCALQVLLTCIALVVLLTGAYYGVGSLTIPLGAGVILLLWFLYAWQCRRVRERIDDAIAAVGEDALEEDIRQGVSYGLYLCLGRRYAYLFRERRLLPLESIRKLTHHDAGAAIVDSEYHRLDDSYIRYATIDGQYGTLLDLPHQSPLLADVLATVLLASPSCVYLYDVKDSLAIYAQETCARICQAHPEAGFIRQHDMEQRMYGVSLTLQEDFIPLRTVDRN